MSCSSITAAFKQDVVCYNCQQSGHMRRDCPKLNDNPKPSPSDDKKPRQSGKDQTKPMKCVVNDTEDFQPEQTEMPVAESDDPSEQLSHNIIAGDVNGKETQFLDSGASKLCMPQHLVKSVQWLNRSITIRLGNSEKETLKLAAMRVRMGVREQTREAIVIPEGRTALYPLNLTSQEDVNTVTSLLTRYESARLTRLQTCSE